MNKFTKETKSIVLRVRISQNERLHLNQLAKQSCLNVSDYVRSRLFEENDSIISANYQDSRLPVLPVKHDEEMIKLIIYIFTLVKEIGRYSLPDDKYKGSIDLALTTLKEWGYNE